MANYNYKFNYNGGHGQLVGSYLPIGYGSVIKYLDLTLSHEPGTLGRLVTVAYWVCDKDFNINDIEMNTSAKNGPRYCSSIDTQTCGTMGINGIDYVKTNSISNDGTDTCRFYFNTDEDGLKAGRIFVAIISTEEDSGYYDYTDSVLSICMSSGSAYIKDDLNSSNIRTDNNGGLLFGESEFVNPDGTSSDSSTSTTSKPGKIQCSDIRYRTWSAPEGSMSITTSGFDNKYTLAYADGGNDASDVSEYDSLRYSSTSYGSGTIITHVNNVTASNYSNSNFESEFGIPEGRLKDVVFASPQSEYYSSGSSNDGKEGRWVFKRSRIKFTIPPAKNSNGIINKAIILRYRVVTSIFDKTVYSSKYKYKQYSVSESTNPNGIELVICPRDEGVLDNMEFTVQISRKYVGTSGSYSDEANYKFRTYQKPTVNISYPKIIRNSATGTGFKYAKILTSNMYSNFNGENSIVNKYVCDALNVMLATPMNDASDIPMYVRFYVAEFKYGRDGRVISDTELDTSNDTIQSLYKSTDSSKYTSLNEILTNNVGQNKMTANMTGIYSNDGQPILLSGRFTNKTLGEVGSEFKLWTYKDWDWVCENTAENPNADVKVGNAWEVSTAKHDENGVVMTDSNGNPIMETLTPLVVGDHLGAPKKEYWSDGYVRSITQTPSKAILFRAGYIYLLRVRMFHGAAAGAIFRNYSQTKKHQILYGNENSGFYNYEGGVYGGEYPESDALTYGQLQPYNGWRGPDDGTSGEPLFDGNVNNAGNYNDRLAMTYAGFSEVDYTLIEPVCPYTSKSNLITVHPTSPQIGANQWITFNYRHLAKNVGGYDYNSSYFDGTKYVNSSKVFGKTASGIQNTLTRMVAMYTSCVETILHQYFTIRGNDGGTAPAYFYNRFMNIHNCSESDPSLSYEKLSLWIKPITQRQLNNTDSLQNFTEAYPKGENNFPIIFSFDINGKSMTAMANSDFYSQDSLCYWFNKYRLKLSDHYNNASQTYDLSHLINIGGMPEVDIIYKRYNYTQQGSANSYIGLEEPMGNVYRWQPVINAMIPSGNSIKEIQIEDKSDNKTIAKAYTIGENTLRQNRTYTSDKVELLYAAAEGNADYDLQSKYFYKDVHTVTAGGNSFTNDDTKRFCIKEFCGSVDGGIYNSGYPVMYTSASTPAGTVYGNQVNTKYFCTDLQVNEYFGHLYSRVPSIQDCENGIPTPNNLPNVGNLSSKGAISVNTNENNVIPITRTTHYLYFKTWINTTFCMRMEVELTGNHSCEYTEDGDAIHVGHESTTLAKTYFYNGTTLVEDVNVSMNPNNEKLFATYPASEIKFGNENGLSEVYGEDNKGWGRCLSADDISNRQIKYDGTINPQKTASGGIEVPVMVRYTPLLQPKLLAKTCVDVNSGNNDKWLSLSSNSISLEKCRGKKQWNATLFDGTITDNGDFKQIRTGQIDLKVAYPFIKETNTYNTVSPNGGNGGNVYFKGYYIDVDTDASKSIDSISNTDASTNMDFLGGNGICTSYTAILVPSNPKIPTGTDAQYFTNTDGHWNFYKQPANYFKLGDIFKNVRSKTVANCGPVLIGYNLQPLEHANTCEYLHLGNGFTIPSSFIPRGVADSTFKGKNYQTISLNFSDLRNGYFAYKNNDGTKFKYTEAKTKLGFELTSANILQVGVIYDLVIIPNYSNITITDLDYNKRYAPGTINGEVPGGNVNEVYGNSSNNDGPGEVLLAGSNPLVLYNYFQIGNETEVTCGGGGGGGGGGYIPDPPTPDPEEPDPTYVYDSDSAIVFPNVDNELFNIEKGTIKEIPGFWLNNTFKLILRLPSFRTKGDEYGDTDINTIDNMSQGYLDSTVNTANDFEFGDIQIHIGKISELEKYGYPDDMNLNLNKLTSKEDLAKAHIISYSHYGHFSQGVFSKKLYADEADDTREKLTAGSLNPTHAHYKNRFIEVNLSNTKIADASGNLVPIYSDYPEGYYIQYRWKTAYSAVGEEDQWSDWYGGTYDGGLKWWGANGLNYFVPIRNYTNIYTDFRNHIKESFPGSYNSMPTEPIQLSANSERIIKQFIGKGSFDKLGSINEDSKNRPKDATTPAFYNVGIGNYSSSAIVPTIEPINVTESLNSSKYGNIKLSVNNDSAYFDEIQHNVSHDKTGPTSGNSFTNHQNFWEMLYVDYIIRNMCKLYYKPKYNSQDSNNQFNSKLYYHLSVPYVNNQPLVLDYLTWGWDNTEYKLFNDNTLITAYKGTTNEREFNEDKSYENNKLLEYNNDASENSKSIRTQGPNTLSHSKLKTYNDRHEWNRNKYYRRVITRQDFDELNSHLEKLVEFIRHNVFTGLSNDNLFWLAEILPVSTEDLRQFKRERHGIIGHNTSNETGLKTTWNNNTINHTMMTSNYIQNTWQNILSVCKPGSKLTNTPDTKNNVSL